ncbi:glucoamylase [Tistlia consotensis]|uniref:glucan 1,4-alpha-glucosidase n=1 Tax=Tistlia consotensis USBA 355 TaxID=560819 RepID=A0A1Y6CEJ7_9PROT|nr:glycoside hydrolase family 15 protein [Tistlia consotensis]SMF58694.1 glucoamylase [Tistlia consotensis USBA 355]SNR63648.1 glucoamylase [Tistlia consotensis]
MAEFASLDAWIERQRVASAERMLACVSATGLERPGPRLGQVMRPAPGSVLAAAEPDPGPGEPDYFFHWLRDGAIVIGALVTLALQGRLPGSAKGRLAESLTFDLSLARRDGRRIAAGTAWPPPLLPTLTPFLRPREEFLAAHGTAVAGEVRFNPDGSLDLLRWGRPQHDGPALRALTTLRMLEGGLLAAADERARAERLLRADLAFCLARHGRPGFDPWEEELGQHFFTRLVQRAAFARGSAWAERRNQSRLAKRLRAAVEALDAALAGHWSEAEGLYRSRLPGPGISESKILDSAVLVAVVHAGPAEGAFGLFDPRVEATVARLEAYFARDFPVNAGRSGTDGLALGRYPGDVYLGGGVFLPCAFALAEYRYRRGESALGDAVLGFLARLLPADGRLPEQLDRASGAPRSAGDLAWSHAALLTAVAARDRG